MRTSPLPTVLSLLLALALGGLNHRDCWALTLEEYLSKELPCYYEGEVPTNTSKACTCTSIVVSPKQKPKLVGPIPPALANCTALVRLEVVGQKLSGPIEHIPTTSLESLDLSNNQMTGILAGTTTHRGRFHKSVLEFHGAL